MNAANIGVLAFAVLIAIIGYSIISLTIWLERRTSNEGKVYKNHNHK